MIQYSSIVFGVYKQDIKTLQPDSKNVACGVRSLRFTYWPYLFSNCVPLSKSGNLSVPRSLIIKWPREEHLPQRSVERI